MYKSDLVGGDAFGNQLAFDVVIDVKPPISVWGGKIAEAKLGQLFVAGFLPYPIDILHTGVDFASGVVGEHGVHQTLVKPDFTAIGGVG